MSSSIKKKAIGLLCLINLIDTWPIPDTTDIRPTVGGAPLTVDQYTTDILLNRDASWSYRPTIDRLLTDCRSIGGWLLTGYRKICRPVEATYSKHYPWIKSSSLWIIVAWAPNPFLPPWLYLQRLCATNCSFLCQRFPLHAASLQCTPQEDPPGWPEPLNNSTSLLFSPFQTCTLQRWMLVIVQVDHLSHTF